MTDAAVHRAVVDNTPVRVMRSGDIVRDEVRGSVVIGHFEFRHLNRFATYTLGLSQDRAAVIDGVDAKVTIIDLRSGATQTKSLGHPELERVKSSRNRVSGAEDLTIVAATRDTSGNIYCMLSGFRPEEGAPILMLDSRANIQGMFRCPVLSGVAKAMVPAAIAAEDGLLFVAGQDGIVSAFFNPLLK